MTISTKTRKFELPNAVLYLGDCREVLSGLPDNSVDSVVCDPPYELGFMGKSWDSTGIAYDVDMWREVLRVLKPGGHLLSFGGTRTYHRMVCAIEDAGFEIRDTISWIYGCLSEDTEILTINGWERYHKNIVSSPVLCYNVSENKFEFHKPTREFLYENKYPAYRIKSDFTDQIVSRNHRVLIERGGRFIFQNAETLKPEEDIPILESLSVLPETIYDFQSNTSIAKCDLLSRVYQCESQKGKDWSSNREDGKTNKGKLCLLWERIRDSRKAKTAMGKYLLLLFVQGKKIFQTLTSLLCQWQRKEKTGNWIERQRQSCMERWGNLFQEKRKLWKVQNQVCEMSKRLFGYGSKGRLCYGTSSIDCSTIEETTFKNGSGSSYRPQSRKQFTGQSDAIQNESGAQNIRRTRATITEIEYTGNVWCIEVPTGAFVARRNGKIFITGNSGFPKSHNIGKAIDKLQGNEREDLGEHPNARETLGNIQICKKNGSGRLTKGTSDYEGWGTGLKPAMELICLARKPLSEKTIAQNVLKWGTGGINIDGCRVEIQKGVDDSQIRTMNRSQKKGHDGWGMNNNHSDISQVVPESGRFPANLIHDGSDEVVRGFPETKSGLMKQHIEGGSYNVYGKMYPRNVETIGDSGSAARFFYCAKSSKRDRNEGCEGLEGKDVGHNRFDKCSNCGGYMFQNQDRKSACKCDNPQRENNIVKGNFHATVKPTSLLQYLCRLITPPNGIILDPFMGSGSTGKACMREGFRFIGIELEPEHIEIAKARIEYAAKQPYQSKLPL